MSMRRWWAGAAVAALFVACDPAYMTGYPVRPEDEAAWRGTKLLELETHEVFSVLERGTRHLSDGTDMWVFPQCTGGGKVHCRSGAFGVPAGQGAVAVANSTCEMDDPKCCYHQFIVADGVVQSYHARGKPYVCRATCASWPESKRAECPSERR